MSHHLFLFCFQMCVDVVLLTERSYRFLSLSLSFCVVKERWARHTMFFFCVNLWVWVSVCSLSSVSCVSWIFFLQIFFFFFFCWEFTCCTTQRLPRFFFHTDWISTEREKEREKKLHTCDGSIWLCIKQVVLIWLVVFTFIILRISAVVGAVVDDKLSSNIRISSSWFVSLKPSMSICQRRSTIKKSKYLLNFECGVKNSHELTHNQFTAIFFVSKLFVCFYIDFFFLLLCLTRATHKSDFIFCVSYACQPQIHNSTQTFGNICPRWCDNNNNHKKSHHSMKWSKNCSIVFIQREFSI